MNPSSKRWLCHINGKDVNHSRVVWEYFNGQIPEGWHIHHRNGSHSNLEDDNITNLKAVPSLWNLHYFPWLTKGFNLPQIVISEVYEKFVDKVEEHNLYKEICRELIRISDNEKI